MIDLNMLFTLSLNGDIFFAHVVSVRNRMVCVVRFQHLMIILPLL